MHSTPCHFRDCTHPPNAPFQMQQDFLQQQQHLLEALACHSEPRLEGSDPLHSQLQALLRQSCCWGGASAPLVSAVVAHGRAHQRLDQQLIAEEKLLENACAQGHPGVCAALLSGSGMVVDVTDLMHLTCWAEAGAPHAGLLSAVLDAEDQGRLQGPRGAAWTDLLQSALEALCDAGEAGRGPEWEGLLTRVLGHPQVKGGAGPARLLGQAVLWGDVEVMRAIAAQTRTDLNGEFEDGSTALVRAVGVREYAAVEWLLGQPGIMAGGRSQVCVHFFLDGPCARPQQGDTCVGVDGCDVIVDVGMAVHVEGGVVVDVDVALDVAVAVAVDVDVDVAVDVDAAVAVNCGCG